MSIKRRLIVVAPRGLYDGRWARWAEQHKRLSWAPILLFLGFLVISGFADDWKFGFPGVRLIPAVGKETSCMCKILSPPARGAAPWGESVT